MTWRESRRLALSLGVAILVAVTCSASDDWNRGLEAFKKKDYAAAASEFEAVIQRAPDYPGGYYMLGLTQRAQRKSSQAIGNLRKAVELDGAAPLYKIELANTLVQAGQYQEAFNLLRALELGALPGNLRTSFALALAKAASEVGQPQAAISALSQQVRADGSNARLHQALAASYAATEDYAKAFEAYGRAFQLSPTDQEVGRAAVRSGIALARRTTSSTAKSNAYSESAAIAEKLATASGTFDNYLLAGEAWMGAGEYQKAVSWFDRARAKQSQNVLVHFYSAQCHTSLGQLDTALAELQQALKIGATGRLRTQVYNQLGFVYDKRKEYDRAKSAYQEAGNSAKVAEMTSKAELAAQNQQAAAEQEEFRRRLAALELQISELEKLGEIDQANELRKQLAELRKVLGD